MNVKKTAVLTVVAVLIVALAFAGAASAADGPQITIYNASMTSKISPLNLDQSKTYTFYGDNYQPANGNANTAELKYDMSGKTWVLTFNNFKSSSKLNNPGYVIYGKNIADLTLYLNGYSRLEAISSISSMPVFALAGSCNLTILSQNHDNVNDKLLVSNEKARFGIKVSNLTTISGVTIETKIQGSAISSDEGVIINQGSIISGTGGITSNKNIVIDSAESINLSRIGNRDEIATIVTDGGDITIADTPVKIKVSTTGKAEQGSTHAYAIYTKIGGVTIRNSHLEIDAKSVYDEAFGILAANDITIDGGTVNEIKAVSNATDMTAAGVCTENGDITITNNAKVKATAEQTANAGTKSNAYGIYAKNGKVRIDKESSVEAKAESKKDAATGICAGRELKIDSNAMVTAKAYANMLAYALVSGPFIAEGKKTKIETYANSNSWSATAIYAEEIAIQSATVSATSESTNPDNIGKVTAIQVDQPDMAGIIISQDATVTATAKTSSKPSIIAAILSSSGIAISDHARVTATVDSKSTSTNQATAILSTHNLTISGNAIVDAQAEAPNGIAIRSGKNIFLNGCNLITATGKESSFAYRNNYAMTIQNPAQYRFSNAISATGGPTTYNEFINAENWHEFTPIPQAPISYVVSNFTSVKIAKTTSIILDPVEGAGEPQIIKVSYGSSKIEGKITNPTRDGYTFSGWFDADEKEIIDKDGNLVKGVAGYTDENGNWICSKTTLTLHAHWTSASNRGHSASIPKDYTPSSYVEPMEQSTAKATATPTPVAPTMMPTAKPTSSTSKSPVPLAGLIAGFGAAALLIRMRR